MKAAVLLVIALGCGVPALSRSEPPPVEIPNTLDQAYGVLDRLLSPADRHAFMSTPEQEAVTRAHMGLGLYIRNKWFRSGKSALPGVLYDFGARSFDDMSGMVLTSYWRHLNGKPIDIEKQGACYRRWFDEEQRLESDAKAKGESSYKLPSFDCP
jgi:hypothetical protein